MYLFLGRYCLCLCGMILSEICCVIYDVESISLLEIFKGSQWFMVHYLILLGSRKFVGYFIVIWCISVNIGRIILYSAERLWKFIDHFSHSPNILTDIPQRPQLAYLTISNTTIFGFNQKQICSIKSLQRSYRISLRNISTVLFEGNQSHLMAYSCCFT